LTETEKWIWWLVANQVATAHEIRTAWSLDDLISAHIALAVKQHVSAGTM